MPNALRLLFALVLVGLMACEEVIDWEVGSDQIKLVAEGRVTNEFKRHQLVLTRTADYFNAADPSGIEGAIVRVSDGISTYNYVEETPGTYVSENSFAGVVGRTYTLSIILTFELAGASTFEASSLMMPSMEIDSIYNVKDPEFDEDTGLQLEDSIYTVGIYGQEIIGVDNSYMFEVYSNDILETNTATNLGWFDDDFLEDEYLEDFLIYEMDRGFENDSITVLMYTVSDEYLEFLEALTTESEGAEPLGLSGPPANVIGNITNGGLGYFYAAALDTVITILD